MTDDIRAPQPDDENSKGGLILVLIFVLGIPILGILYGLFIAKPDH